MAIYNLTTNQAFPISRGELWNFISSPKNLKEITPNYMGFDIVSEDLAEQIYAGMIIHYKVSPILEIKLSWITEITHCKEGEYFIDEQRFGPYKFWHHTHKISAIDGGVIMTDTVHYLPSMGFLGRIANTLFIRKKLKQIFEHRRLVLEKKFGTMPGNWLKAKRIAFAGDMDIVKPRLL